MNDPWLQVREALFTRWSGCVATCKEEAAQCYKDCDDTYRSCCCECFSYVGVRPVYPSDPWFEATVLDNFRLPLDKTSDEAVDVDWIERAILDASPRIAPELFWLCCTSDTACCGHLPATEEAAHGFRVIRRAKVVDLRTGKTHITVWPQFQDAAEAAMRSLRDPHGRPIEAIVMDRSMSGRNYALLEAAPIDENDLRRRPAERVPMAKVLCNEETKDDSFPWIRAPSDDVVVQPGSPNHLAGL
mmetsp:Transcript_5078/g.15338  ORF Transcript_5078/g.15338 Transcript_5078/m.15338 type:complete len:244 (-) Transcript_5078:307-1038(-)